MPSINRAGPPHEPPSHGGNGHAHPPEPDRFARIELLLDTLQREVHRQFQRIAAMQVQLDRAIADRPIPPKR